MKQHGDKNCFVWPNRQDCIYYQDQEDLHMIHKNGDNK